MNKVKALHREAMRLAISKQYVEAAKKEYEAAQIIPQEKESEPTRSILFVSAASLYLLAGYSRLAEQVAIEGLTYGYPDKYYIKELMKFITNGGCYMGAAYISYDTK